MRLCIFYLFVIKVICANPTPTPSPTPIVLWHGMVSSRYFGSVTGAMITSEQTKNKIHGDTCCVVFSLGAFKQFLEDHIPGVYVHSLRIGNSTIEDYESGYFMSPNKQIPYVFKQIMKDPKLKNGFNAIGFSQGGQFFRGLVQRYGHMLPPIKNMISLGGQHQGVYGLPNCGAILHESCDYIRKLLNYAAYKKWMQDYLVQATYWHDPLNETEYKKNSEFLSDINNEMVINQTYIDNLNKLEKFVMVKFSRDTIVQPRETEWFGYYAPGQSKKLITLQESKIYIKDRLGLQKMDKAGKLAFLVSEGNHLRFSDQWFIDNVIKPYLI